MIPQNVILPGTELLNKHKDKIYLENDIKSSEEEILYLQNEIIKVMKVFCWNNKLLFFFLGKTIRSQVKTREKSN